MGKRVKFSLDLVISDDKKEVEVKEAENTEIVPQNTGNIIVPGSAKRTKRKKLFTIGVVIVGILLLGLGTYGIIRQGTVDQVIEEPPKYEVQEPQVQEPQIQEPQVQEPQVQEPQVQEPVRILDAQDPELRKSGMVEYSDLVDGESSPCESLNDRLNFFPTDPKTRSIMESGYYYELDNVVEDGIFKLEFVAASGYADNPMLLLNVYVDDEELVAQNDKIEVFAYCLDKEYYDNEIDHYGQWNAYGVQDKNDPHLYRVTLPSGSHLSGNTWVVFDMTTIRFGTRDTEWKEYQVNLKEMIKVPYHIAFYPTLGISTEGLEFKSDTKTYKLYWTHIAHDLTDLVFFYDFDDVYYDEKVVGNDGVQFGRFIKEVVLEIDGVEYKVNPDARPYINMTEDRDNVQYYVYAEFPGVKDVVGIKEVIVKYRDVEYKLR